MKKWFNIGKVGLVALAMMTANQSCTNLDEEIFSDVSAEVATATEGDLIAAIAGCYTKLYDFGGHNGSMSISEVSTDEVIIPQRGGDWLDGGQWLRMHRHEYNAAEQAFGNAWNQMYNGIGRCNLILAKLEGNTDGNNPAYQAELRALRAYYYYWLLDLFGNVPVVEVVDPNTLPTNKTRAEVFNYVESELLAALPNLSTNAAGMYGRLHKSAVEALLCKLYLNAEVYTGTARWDDCITYADKVKAAGIYSTAVTYSSIFAPDNANSPEHIFAIPFDNVTGRGFVLCQMTLHYSSQNTFGLQEQPWNGYCTSAEFYNSYEAGDVRRANNLLAGPQFEADGVTPLTDPSVEAADPDGPTINFTPTLNEHFPNCLRQAGARIGKYAYEPLNQNMNNDLPLLRYSDILMAKAEALWHKDNGSAEALAIVNDIRTRAGVAGFASLNPDNLLAERGREFFYEGVRRQDLIRFGKYESQLTAQMTSGSDTRRRIFPIPVLELNANPKLDQNPGY